MAEPLDARRTRRLVLSWDVIPAIFQAAAGPDWVTCDTPIPADLVVLDVRVDYWRQAVTYLVSSTSFDVTPPGADPPEWELIFTRHAGEGAVAGI